MLESTQPPSVFTATSAYSLAGVAGIALVASTAARALLPKNASWQDRATFIWLVRTPIPNTLFSLPLLTATTRTRPSIYAAGPKSPPPPQTFDALIHFIFEGSFLALSTFGRTVNTSSGPLAQMCACLAILPPSLCFFADVRNIISTGREYAAADSRWGTADPTVVSLELLTVLGAGPMAAFIVYQIVRRDPARHYWIVVLSTAELYGGYVLREAEGA